MKEEGKNSHMTCHRGTHAHIATQKQDKTHIFMNKHMHTSHTL